MLDASLQGGSATLLNSSPAFTQAFIEACNVMGLDAFTPGEGDLGRGLERLEELLQRARFPILAANLVRSRDGSRPFGSLRLKEVGGWKVGVIGVVGTELRGISPIALHQVGVRLLPPEPIVRRAVSVLRRAGADLIILNAHMDRQELTRLLEAMPGAVEVAVAGHERYQSQPLMVGSTVIVGGGSRGRELGRLELTLKGRPIRLQNTGSTAPLEKQIGASERRITYLRQTLSGQAGQPAVQAGSAAAHSQQRLSDALTREQEELARLRQQLEDRQRTPDQAWSTFAFTLQLLDSRFADDPEVAGLLNRARLDASTRPRVPQPSTLSTASVVAPPVLAPPPTGVPAATVAPTPATVPTPATPTPSPVSAPNTRACGH